jgi:hypothetical protein
LILIISLILMICLWRAIALVRLIVQVKSKQSLPRTPKRIDTRAEALSPQMREFLSEKIAQFHEEGFEVAANHWNQGGLAGASAMHVVLLKRGTGDIGHIIIVIAKTQRSFSTSVESKYPDGTTVVTAFQRFGSANEPKNPQFVTANFPWARDVRVLCEAHRRRLVALRRSESKREPPAADKIESWLNQKWVDINERNVKAGRRWFDPNADVYRHTWKGATLAVLNSLPAVRRFRNHQKGKIARRMWNELNMDSFSVGAAAAGPREADFQKADRLLRNRPTLAAGEVTHDRSDGWLVVHVGGYSVANIIARGWFEMMLICLISLAFAIFIGVYYGLWALTPGGGSIDAYLTVGAVLWLLYIVQPVLRLARVLASSGGTISLAASPAGLCCHGVPRLGEVTILSRDLEQISAVKFRFGRRWVGRIKIRRFEMGSRQRETIVPIGDLAELVQLRKDLAEAIGIEVPVVPPPLPQSVGAAGV